MRVPFPLALNIGTDIICINRLIRSFQSAISKFGSTYESTSTPSPSQSSKVTLVHLSRLSTRFLHPKELIELQRRFPFLRQHIQSQQPGRSRNLQQEPNKHGLSSDLDSDLDEAESKSKLKFKSRGQNQSEQNNGNTDHDINETLIRNLATHLAGRWAAKEAAKKAWGAKLLSFKDLRVEILDFSSGEVGVVCQSYSHGNEDEDEIGSLDSSGSKGESSDGSESHGTGSTMEQVAKLSISHDGDYAVATVIAAPLHGDILKELESRRDAAWKKIGRRS